MAENQEEIQVSSNPQVEALKGLISPERLSEIAKTTAPTNEQGQGGGQQNQGGEQQGQQNQEGAQNQEQGSQEGGEGSQEQNQEGQQNQEGAQQQAAGEQQAAPVGEEKKVKNPLGLKPKGKEAGQQVVIENEEQLLSAIKTKYGQEYKSIKDLPKFFESFDKIRTSAQKAEEFEKENKQLKELWEEKLPVTFLEAAKVYLQGGDYTSVFLESKSPVDFKKPADQQDIKTLINNYFPGEFTDEDFTSTEPNKALELAKKSSLDKFNLEKQQRDSKSAQIQADAQKAIQAKKAAAEGSLNYLQSNFPDMAKENFTTVKQAIEGGPQAVLQFFFNADGTAKQDAAEKFTLAMFGKEQIQEMMEVAANQTETRVNEELLTRGADGPKPNRAGSGVKEQISEETKAKLEELRRISSQNKTTF